MRRPRCSRFFQRRFDVFLRIVLVRGRDFYPAVPLFQNGRSKPKRAVVDRNQVAAKSARPLRAVQCAIKIDRTLGALNIQALKMPKVVRRQSLYLRCHHNWIAVLRRARAIGISRIAG